MAMAQVGAFASESEANAGWRRAMLAAPQFASGKGKRIRMVKKDAQTFHRSLVTGFESLQAADDFCSALTAKQIDCFVRQSRGQLSTR